MGFTPRLRLKLWRAQWLERYGVCPGHREGVLKGRFNRGRWEGQWLEEIKPFCVCNPMFWDSVINHWQYWEILPYLYIDLQFSWWFRWKRSYEPGCTGPPKMDGSWWRILTNPGPPEKEMANHSSILASRTPSTVWKGKKIWHWKMNPPGQYMSDMLLEKSGEFIPERMKRLGQSRNDAQLWICLVVKVKSDVIKNNTA